VALDGQRLRLAADSDVVWDRCGVGVGVGNPYEENDFRSAVNKT
jgi:hypothetical protein